MNMGEIIKMLRLREGMSQEELGKQIGVKRAAVMKYEKGDIENLKHSTIFTLANIFNVSPNFIMGWGEGEDTPSLKEVKIFESIRLQYGEEAVEILQTFLQLNKVGRDKLINLANDFKEIEKYTEREEVANQCN